MQIKVYHFLLRLIFEVELLYFLLLKKKSVKKLAEETKLTLQTTDERSVATMLNQGQILRCQNVVKDFRSFKLRKSFTNFSKELETIDSKPETKSLKMPEIPAFSLSLQPV